MSAFVATARATLPAAVAAANDAATALQPLPVDR
jgi:hypothetical protein